ncbi:uncharacterized protein ATNIH1004_004272 [Aspergillus tanneri]|uniref:Uncharacterized protein n=1 Tax=Aspergillus tanneri TaxID=1220188 RepID=A0A5M9N169_9EURO|nr:uncharacterized protein ATNIH1004_004272 [Aspergillus tanneri]KAA8648387.1 hypothetical protein ATNIH1004_004272 [Aspergillus tanneri]
MSRDDKSGFAIRRHKSCQDGEAACGPTWGDFHACCPHGSTCPGANTPYVNSVCCPSKSNCTELILDPPVCADRSWTLYDHEGYFCCHKDMRGFFVTDMSWVGCAGPNSPGETNYQMLKAISTATPTPTTASVSSTSLLTSKTTAPTTTAGGGNSGSNTNTGAIAGGVVGGVAGLAVIIGLLVFFIRRWKEQQVEEQQSDSQTLTPRSPQYSTNNEPKELQGSLPAELVGSSRSLNHEVHELPSSS